MARADSHIEIVLFPVEAIPFPVCVTAVEHSQLHRAEADLECPGCRWKQTNLFTPEDFGDKHFLASPANRAVLAY